MAKKDDAVQNAPPACQRCGGALDWKSGVCHSCGTINEIELLKVKQSRLRGGSLVTPHSVVATNRALKFQDPKMFGMRQDITELPFEHIDSIKKKGGLRGSTLIIHSGSHGTIELEGISGDDADKIIEIYKKYTTEIARQYAAPAQHVPQQAPRQASTEDPMQTLTKLKGMHEAGLITEEEYNTKRAEVLSKM